MSLTVYRRHVLLTARRVAVLFSLRPSEWGFHFDEDEWGGWRVFVGPVEITYTPPGIGAAFGGLGKRVW